jgi:heme/copper-type cytochrome/quinol oxidase subunit 3
VSAPDVAPDVAPDGVRTRPYLDVAELPDVAFGSRDLMWWGTLGFVVIEGFTLALCATVYLYLWKNFHEWPPAGTERPTLGPSVAQLAVMLASLPLCRWTARAARRFDLRAIRVGQTASAALVVAMAVLRWFELDALHVRWNTNAYGSAAWLVVGMHGTLIALKLIESVGMAAMLWLAPVEENHFSDIADDAFYLAFVVLSWIPLFALCYVGPRVAA